MPDSLATDADFQLGRAALLEVTSAESIGAPAGSIDEGDGVVTVYFDTLLSGYPGWRWTVSIAHVNGEAPSVLETELTPGDDALLSPAWVPWVDRLADYTAAQETELDDDETNDEIDDELDPDAVSDDEDYDDESDDDDDDDLGSDVLHGGDLDGVDIDDLDEAVGVDDIDEEEPVKADAEESFEERSDGELDDEPEDEHERSV